MLKRIRIEGTAQEPARVLRPCVAIGALAFAAWLVLARCGLAVACPLKGITGVECAFCGATRATQALLAGHVGRALNLNLFYTVVVLPVCGLAVIVAAGPARWERSIVDAYRRLGRPRLALEFGLVMLVVWTVARNVPALDWLAAG